MKKILILGAGFGGLRAAKQIAKKLKRFGLNKKYEVILVDKNDHHTYTPLLYEVATTSKTTADMCELHKIAAYDINSLIADSPIKFVKDTVLKIDVGNGCVHLKNGSTSPALNGIEGLTAGDERISYDYAVIAPGAEVNYFGIRGLKENSLPLKEFVDAIKIRDKIWNLATEKQSDVSVSGYHDIGIVVGGGGSTGTELAGELRSWRGELEKEFKKCRLDVTVIEAGPSVLAGFPGKIIKKVERRLKELGVNVIIGKKIAEATKKEVILDDGRKIPFDLLIWSGGVKAPELLTGMPFKFENKGRAVVESGMNICVSEDMHLHIQPKIYGIGDSICFYNPLTGQPVPGVANAAISQANIAAHNLIEDVRTGESRIANRGEYKPKYKQYKPMDYPYIIPVGGKWAVAKVGPFIISGFAGWILKGLVELNYLLSIMPFWRAIKIWFKGLKIFMQNDRLG